MSLFIQDPDDSEGLYLVEALLKACQGACRGGGAFAFASAAGAKLFLEDESFVEFAAAHSFDLILGVDAITNRQALDAIKRAAATARAMNVRVFLHERPGTIFHPKFCWFRGPRAGQLIVGSGNLTIGGLRTNWESFSVTPLRKAEADKVEASWTRWIHTHNAALLPPDDPRVIERASRNTGTVRLVGSQESFDDGVPKSGVTDEPATPPVRAGNVALIAEIPKSGDRWNQANFDIHSYEQFFGARRGTLRRVVLQHVSADGSLGEIENRPNVAVKSHNYRFELDAASGLAYPARRRPIGVFVRVAARTFRYRLLMPGDPHYSVVQTFLTKRWSGNTGRMRRVSVAVEELRGAWPASPLWRFS